MRWQPALQIIPHYESESLYIEALKKSVVHKLKKHFMETRCYCGVLSWNTKKKYFDKGDPYHCYCHKTTRLLTEKLKIKIPIETTFQSRFGPDEWLQPYTDKTLESLPGMEKKMF